MNRRGLFKFALALSGLPLVRRIPAVKRWRYRYGYWVTAVYITYPPDRPHDADIRVDIELECPIRYLRFPAVEVYRTTANALERIA